MTRYALLELLKQKSIEVHQKVIDIRRRLHQYPELSFEETETMRYIASVLDEAGVFYEAGWAKTGIVAYVYGHNPDSRVRALRADMDALPIVEENEVEYRSQNEGVMHACGHDVHTASLLGSILILHDLRHEFEGTIKCIFQPGEEKYPGGASILIEEGVLDNPKPSAIIGQHVHPTLPAGKVGVRAGKFMASADELYLTIRGKGGHGAMPHKCVDAIYISAQVIIALQQIVSRRSDPTIPSVLTIGKIESVGGATNVIPEEVRMLGTFRTFDESWRQEAHRLIEQTIVGVVEGLGGKVDFELKKSYPCLENNPTLYDSLVPVMKEYLGEENVVEVPQRMGAEDFAFYSQEIPSLFYRLGTGFEDEDEARALHSSRFDVDENALISSTGLMAWMALNM